MSLSLLIPKPSAEESIDRSGLRRLFLQDLDRIDTYPVLTETTARAMALVNNPDASPAEVGNLIRRDAVVAAGVLRRANNWTFGAKRVIDNIQQAVLRVGLQECGRMICTLGLRGVYERYPELVRKRCDVIHRHSLFVAQLAGEMNRTAGFGFSGVEFTAGLLHDIGRIVLAVKSPPDTSEATERESETLLDTEREQFGVDHCAVGYQFALRNGLPEPLVRVILNHHRPAEEHLHTNLVALIGLSNCIANHAQRTHNISAYDLTACPVFPVLARDWTGPREDAFARALPGIVVRAFKATRQMLKSFG